MFFFWNSYYIVVILHVCLNEKIKIQLQKLLSPVKYLAKYPSENIEFSNC